MAWFYRGAIGRIQFEDQVVGIIESRDGTIMDVVRGAKPYTTFDE